MSDWQLIESFFEQKKIDLETSVILWKPDERMVGEYMVIGYWNVEEKAWYSVGGHKLGYFSLNIQANQGYPTHWKPCPQPPKGIR